MIGRYLAALNAEQRDRVLTTHMRPGQYDKKRDQGPCLVGTAGYDSESFTLRLSARRLEIEDFYDGACKRKGTAWVNHQIRLKLLFGRGPALSYRVEKSVQVVTGPPPTWAR